MALSMRFIECPLKDRSKTNLHFYSKRSCFRTTKEGSKSLMYLFQGHDIFYNKSSNPQAHSGWQLAVGLMRIGTYGNGASAVRVVGTLFLGQGTSHHGNLLQARPKACMARRGTTRHDEMHQEIVTHKVGRNVRGCSFFCVRS
ncbi:hypothetical protein BKA57DRAFT_472711 [Linnemannia elongata]|nr:hypothetical protein BKA57DRAFT_472711 [Linnemannia elongata]